MQHLKFVGYDRTCDLHPFLVGLQRKGVRVDILLQNTKFLVDNFHCLKPSEKCSMPLDNPECKYHTDLDTFKEVHETQNALNKLTTGLADTSTVALEANCKCGGHVLPREVCCTSFCAGGDFFKSVH